MDVSSVSAEVAAVVTVTSIIMTTAKGSLIRSITVIGTSNRTVTMLIWDQLSSIQTWLKDHKTLKINVASKLVVVVNEVVEEMTTSNPEEANSKFMLQTQTKFKSILIRMVSFWLLRRPLTLIDITLSRILIALRNKRTKLLNNWQQQW